MSKARTLNPYDMEARIHDLEENGGGGGSSASAKRSDIATEFSTKTSYTAGNYVYYEGTLYIFNVDHAAGEWDATDVAVANVTDEVTSNKAAIDALAAELKDDYVSVTADGVKTVAQLLNDLFTAADLTKLKNDSKAVRITDSATVVYHLVEYNSSSAYFSYDVVTSEHWQILTFILKNNDSNYRQVYDGSKVNKSTDVPASGTVFRIYY